MKQFCQALIYLLALLCATATPAVTIDEARHLLHRTGYGVTASEWNRIIDLDYEDAVDLIISEASGAPRPRGPDWAGEKPPISVDQRGMSSDQRKAFLRKRREMILELSQWWLEHMITTPQPLRERMTMFWSNHFVTSSAKTIAPVLLYRQNQLLRNHAMGSFDKMTHAIIRDPAMLMYLDNNLNRRESINENFARELMELFTIGEGHYSEDDVKAAARSLTGFSVKPGTGEFVFRKRQHDTSEKQILGQRGNFDGDDLVSLLLDQPQTAERIVRKLWLEFVSMQPDEQRIAEWAGYFRDKNYQIAPLLRLVFLSDEFRDPQNRGVLIKSPVEFYVGLARPGVDGIATAQQKKRLRQKDLLKLLPRWSRIAGQNLFRPPSVEGWPGGIDWINSKTMLAREQYGRNVLFKLGISVMKQSPYENRLVMSTDELSGQNDGTLKWFMTALDPLAEVPAKYLPARRLIGIVSDPVVHLK